MTRRPATPEETRALAHPLRLRILRLTLDTALTNKQLADRLDQDPGTVLHHVRALVATGFLALEEERPGPRGSTEKLYLSTGKSWSVDVAGTQEAHGVRRAALEAFLAELAEAGEEADLSTSRLALRLTPERLNQLTRRLGALLDEYASAGATEGERYALFLAIHRRPP